MRQRPGTFSRRGILVDAVEDTGLFEIPVRGLEAARNLGCPQRSETGEKRSPMRPHLAVLVDHLVVKAALGAITANER